MDPEQENGRESGSTDNAVFDVCTPDSGGSFPESCSFVIFGASGDLARRKLIPALFNLYRLKRFPDRFLVMGCARTPMSDEEFRLRMREAVSGRGIPVGDWRGFAERLFYTPMKYTELSAFRTLETRLRDCGRECAVPENRIYYLAVPPGLYESVSTMLGEAGLSRSRGWVRIVVEKPFGHDLRSSIRLNRVLHRHFEERQIFRIDHYLAKETVQNVLTFRFANSIFEPLWNRMHIDRVHIAAAETIGVGKRAGYYEEAGVLRDMFQNHMMQLLALVAMEPPSRFEADFVQDEKVKVFRSLKPFPEDALTENIVLGQYRAGTIDGVAVPGYREEPSVAPDSTTPTYAMVRVFIDNWRWQGVPFYVCTGKRLARKVTHIVVHFKEVPYSMFRNVLGEHITENVLTFGIQPVERIRLSFQTKVPGPRLCLRPVSMLFDYEESYSGAKPDAYEKALLDCMAGDRMLFWRQDGVEICWSYVTPILEYCEACTDRSSLFHFYRAGSWGPRVSDPRMSLEFHMREG